MMLTICSYASNCKIQIERQPKGGDVMSHTVGITVSNENVFICSGLDEKIKWKSKLSSFVTFFVNGCILTCSQRLFQGDTRENQYSVNEERIDF